ncbi:hypothetical protein ACFL6U_20070 [Planctomycetota bacterium]
MYQRMPLLLSVVVIWMFVGSVHAEDVTWTGAGGDLVWTNPANWDSQSVPGIGQQAIINADPGPVITTDVVCGRMKVGAGSGIGELTIDGGNLTMVKSSEYDGQLVVVTGDTATGTLNIKNGSVTIPANMSASWRGVGTINLDGGVLKLDGNIKLVNKASSDSTINLYAGKFIAEDIDFSTVNGSKQLTNVMGGSLVLNGNDLENLQQAIADGLLVAYNDNGGTVIRDYDEVTDTTTVRGQHVLAPVPNDGALVLPSETAQLSWTLPDPCTPGQPVQVDVYITDDLDALLDFSDPDSIRVVDQQNVSSVSVPVEVKKPYYWVVDTYIGSSNDPVFGPIFRFSVDHAAPEVDAGEDIITFLQEGTVTGPLMGKVTDDGHIQPYTVQWTVVSEPNSVDTPAVIADSTSETTEITLNAAGTYVLELMADDGEYTGSDTMTITAYGDDWNPAG